MLKRLEHVKIVFFAVVIALLTMQSRPARAQYYHTPLHVGVRCQADFQNNWQVNVNPYPTCSSFIDQISDTDYVDFYYDLHGGNGAFTYGNPAETQITAGGVDSVDFFFMYTHGAIAANNATDAGWTMWDVNDVVWAPSMILGQTGEQVKVFSTYSSDTLKTSDGLFWARWGGTMSGGVKLLTGAHDVLWDEVPEAMTNWAADMRSGLAIGYSWNEETWNANWNNHPSVANTGVNADDCWARQNATLGSVMTEPTLRGGQFGYVCYSGWNGY